MRFPGPWSWFALSLRRGFATARDLVAPVALASFAICAVLTPIVALTGFVQSQTTSETALTQIDVTARTHDTDDRGITSSQLDEIGALPGVASVIPDATIGIYAANGETWAIRLRALNPANVPPDVSDDITDLIFGNSVMLPARAEGADFSGHAGKDIVVAYTRMTGEATGVLAERSINVVGVYDPSWQGYGPDVALGSAELLVELLAARSGLGPADYMETHGISAAVVTAASAEQVTSVTEEIRELGLVAVPIGDRLGELPGVFAMFPQILALTVIGSALLLLLQLTRAVRAALSSRTPEFGLLRIRAWSPNQVRKLLLLDVLAGSFGGATLGASLGAVAGTLLLNYLIPGLNSRFLTPIAAMVPTVATAITLFCLTVMFLASWRMLRTDPFITVMSRSR